MEIVWQFLKKLNIELTCNPAIPILNIYPKELKVGTHLYIHVHNSITDNSQKLKAVQVSVDRGIRKTNLAYIYKYTHTYTHTHNHTHTTHKGILFSLKGKEIPHATTRMNLEDMMLVK